MQLIKKNSITLTNHELSSLQLIQKTVTLANIALFLLRLSQKPVRLRQNCAISLRCCSPRQCQAAATCQPSRMLLAVLHTKHDNLHR